MDGVPGIAGIAPIQNDSSPLAGFVEEQEKILMPSPTENGTNLGWGVIIALGSLVLGWLLSELSKLWSQRRLFDHRLRLEKEYQLYSELWDKLFALCRAVRCLVEDLSCGSADHGKDAEPMFNAYQEVVRKGEPFMRPEVYAPAKKLADLARRIIMATGKQQRLEKETATSIGSPTEGQADRFEKLQQDKEAALNEIAELREKVKEAIRKRIAA